MSLYNFFKRIQPLLIWGIADLYFILAVTVTILFGALAPDLQKQLNLTAAQLGLLGFSFFLSFGITQLLTGNLIDTLGPRIALTLSACIATFGLFLLSNATGLSDAIIAQIIIGAGFSSSYVGAIYLASSWFPNKYFSILSGITQMSAYIVSASLILFMALFGALEADFRKIILDLTFITLLIGTLLFLIVRKATNSNPTRKVNQRAAHFWKDLYKLFHISQFWLGAIYFGTNIGVLLAFSSLWNIPDSLAYGRTLQTATMLSATLRYGSACGALLSGLLASYFKNNSIIARIYSFGTLVVSIILIYGPLFSMPIAFVIFALFGFFLGGTALGFPLVEQYIPPTLKGTGFGFMVALGYFLSAFLEYLPGILLGGPLEPGSPDAMYAFKIALTPLMVMLLVGCFCTFSLKNSP